MTLLIYRDELHSLMDVLKAFKYSDISISIKFDNKESKLDNYLLQVTFSECTPSVMTAIWRAGYAQAEKNISQNKNQ